MTTFPRLYVYKASAGSGKTFTLAVQYIRQLIEDPHAYRHILAVTFTNKATAEMKERILSQLYGLATGDAASDGYLNEIRKATGKTDQDIRQAARDALRYIIHDYSRFRIETIDSFFQSVMRNLARELELGANLSIELNNSEVLSEAVDTMIEKLDRRSPVLGWLLEYIEERIDADRRWNVSDEIKGFGRNIFDEEYIERGEGLRKKLEDPAFIPSYRKKLHDLQQEALSQMAGFCGHFNEVLESHGLSAEQLKNGLRGIASYFRKLNDGKLGNDIRNTTVEKCLESSDNWATKTSPYRDAIRQLAESELIPLLEEAELFRSKNNLIVNSCTLALRHLNNLRLLTRIDGEVRLLNQASNRFMLSDTNALLHNLIREGDASFVYEKIGTTIDTVMIDEFQDTSRMQWENFRLLLQESLAQKEGSLIVGDIKQSIYRWRNGDWKILAQIDRDRAFHIKECPLDTNWRSESRIIAFNNAVFQSAVKVLNQQYKTDTGEECEALVNAYKDVVQKSSKTQEKGYVKLSFLNEDKDHPYTELMLKELAAEVDRLHAQGVALNDIAILVRKNKTIPAVADFFDKETPYRIVSDEAFRLDASQAICMLIDGLRVLASPDDRIARARLAVAYQHEVCHRDTDLNTILLNRIDDFLPEAFISAAGELRLMPLYELIEKLYILFDIRQIENQDAYLCAFHDAVTEYLQNKASELTAFLQYWDERLHEKTIPSGEIDGIRILSIHKSKGLEYHTVLLPFCDWKMENETNNHLVWCETPRSGDDQALMPFGEIGLLPVNYSNIMAESVFRNSYLDERLQLWIDNLNLLYVAFTRACKNLVIWGKTGLKGSVSELLEKTIDGLEGIELNAYEEATPCAGTSPEDEVHRENEVTESPLHRRLEFGTLSPSETASIKVSGNRLTPHAESVPVIIEPLETTVEFRQSNRSADFINGDEEEGTDYIRQGQLLHAIFASIEKADDLERVVEQLKNEGILETAEQEKKIIRLARRALNHPAVASWYDGSAQLYNECAIIYTDEEGQLQTRRPDRVMVFNDKVTVVDFKFGKKKDAYRQQVHDYMDLLSDMGYEHIEGYLWYVYTNELEQV